jgi:uncharacterized membrane protein
MLMNLSAMGLFHTLIGILALISGFWILYKKKRISYDSLLGKIYLFSTLVTAASSLSIFKNGSFNVAHALGVLTILAVFTGMLIEKTIIFKSWNKYFINLCYSSTILFHLIPTATEVLTRFPIQAPLVSSIESPLLHKTFLIIFILYLVMLFLQMKWLKNQND